MSRLNRAVESKRALVEAHQRDLQARLARFHAELGERASRPQWLAAAFAAGLLGGLGLGRQRRQRPPESGERKRSSPLDGLLRQLVIPFAVDLLRQYLGQRAAGDGPAAGEEQQSPPPEPE